MSTDIKRKNKQLNTEAARSGVSCHTIISGNIRGWREISPAQNSIVYLLNGGIFKMLNVRLCQIHDMFIFRHHNAFMTPNQDGIIVAPPKNACYALITCMDDKHFSINLLRCATGDILKTDVARYPQTVIATVEKLLNYSELILECKRTSVSANRYLYVSVTGQENEVILSIMQDSDSDIGDYAVKVLPVTFADGVYKTGYCKQDYIEYDSAYELVSEFIKGGK